jgi:hypothetical protein
MKRFFSSPSYREHTPCSATSSPSRDRSLARLVLGWFSACLRACLNLSEYGEIDPELQTALAVVPPRDEHEAMFEQSPYLRVGTSRLHIVRLVPWACALAGPHCPSSVCADPHCRYRDR